MGLRIPPPPDLNLIKASQGRPRDDTDTREPVIDKQHRVCDKLGRPLRFKTPGQPAFHGNEGKPHPRLKRLRARQDAYDNGGAGQGRKRPGSVKK